MTLAPAQQQYAELVGISGNVVAMVVQGPARPPNWYLDPLVAAQKRDVHLRWVARNVPAGSRIHTLLKTDLFEEAYGQDELLFSLPFETGLRIGFDVESGTVVRAASREGGRSCLLINADVRRLPLADASVDVALSNSTLDHFRGARDIAEQDIEASLRELARILKPGGILLVTLDNPRNPLFLAFRAAVGWLGSTYPLGKTLPLRRLLAMLERVGLEVKSTDWLIHNPRFVSTLVFLALRRLLGRRADGAISLLLVAFSALGSLPTRSFTGAFLAACARKPGGNFRQSIGDESAELAHTEG
jgi:SAM-dependent methyltransferase